MKKLKNIILLFLLIFGSQATFAQEEFEDDAPDVPAASINDQIILAALSGILLGYKFIKCNKEA